MQYAADERATGPEFDSHAQFLVFLPLVARNADGELQGRLARSWEPSEDYGAWTVHLNTDVRWHDGVPVTAADIQFSVALLSRPDVGYIGPGTVAITVLDDSTFIYRSSMSSPLEDYRTYYPRHLLEPLDPTKFYEWEFWTEPVGNGPYRYVRHVPKTMMELEANPDYFLGKPAIERVILKFGEPQLTELLAGNVDVLTSVSPMDLPKIATDPRFEVHYQYGFNVESIYWNHRTEFFEDARVRRALTLAIDRRELVDVLNLAADLPLFDVIFSERQRGELPEPLPYDRRRAERLLDEAGWRDADGDGVRERGDKEFGFTLLVQGTDGGRVGVYIQDQLRKVGVRVEIRSIADWVTLFRQVRSGNFEAAVFGHAMSVGGTRGHLSFFGDDSYLGYESPRVAGLLEAIVETGNPREKDALFESLWPIFQEDVPLTILYPVTSTHVVRRRIRGLSSPFRGDPVWYMEHLWIDNREEPSKALTVLFAGDEWIFQPADYEYPTIMFEPLAGVSADGTLEGRLARHWELAPDGRTWTVQLRTDVRWHDGVPVTAHDIKFTLDLLSHPDVAQIAPAAFSFTLIDDSTYTITLHRPESGSPLDDGRVYYPRHLLKDLDPADVFKWEFWTQPIGNGPYRYVRHIPKTMMEFEANPDYYRGAPKLERVIIKFGDASLPELLAGNVDVLTEVTQIDLLKIREDSRFQIYYRIAPVGLYAIIWNLNKSILEDVNVRRALTLAIDRRELHRVLNLPDGVPIFDGFVTPVGHPLHDDQVEAAPEPLPYSPVEAKRLLAEAGWQDSDHDGVLERGDERFRFEALVPAGVRGLPQSAVFVQSQLERVGVRMEVVELEWGLVIQRMRGGDFDAIFHVLVANGHPMAFFGENGIGARAGYINREADSLLAAAAESMDVDQISAIFLEITSILQDDVPVTFLYPQVWTTVAHRRVKGLSEPYRTDPLWHLDEVWIEE